MPDLTVWPTDGADGSVSSEARWRKMARHWVPSGVVPVSADTLTGQLAPALVAGPAIQVQNGGCWLDGHYAELQTAQTVPVAADGLLVCRFTPADNRTELLFRAGAGLQPTQTLATWELPIARMTAGAMTDIRIFAKQGRDAQQRPGVVLHGTAVLPCSSAVEVALTYSAGWASMLWLVDNMFNPAANASRITCRTYGLYQVSSVVSWAGNITGRRAVLLRLNGGLNIGVDQRPALAYTGAPAAVCTADSAISAVWPMSPGDYVEQYVWQDSGAAVNITRWEFSANALSY